MENYENNGFGPFLKQRKHWLSKLVAFLLIIVVALILVLWSSTNPLDFFSSFIAASVLGQLLRRLCLFVEEYRHRHSRYEGSWKKAFNAVFECESQTFLCSITLISSFYFLASRDNLNCCNWSLLIVLNAIFQSAVLLLFESPLIEISRFLERESKNLADGLAWGYYFGYLKFVLPALRTQINKTDQVRNLIKVEKLFILIPKNCVISANQHISNKDTDPRGLIKVKCPLVPLKKSRGGIIDMEYRHTVHSIKDYYTGKEHLCIMEYATPIMTLHDMSNDPKAGLSRQEKDIQVNLFVCKLREILDANDECKGKYEIITFAGGNQDLAEIMIRALYDCDLLNE